MPNNIPESELKDWLNYLKGEAEDITDSKDESKHHEGSLTIDLHHKTLDQSYKILEQSFILAQEKQLTDLEIITGIGTSKDKKFGILYEEIPKFLKYGKFNSLIKDFNRASSNAGVILVKLKI